MANDAAFIQVILASPEDDSPRLVYADWLEEQEDAVSSAKAKFLRLTVQLAMHTEQRAGEKALRKHLQQLRQLAVGLEPDWLAAVSRPTKNWLAVVRGLTEEARERWKERRMELFRQRSPEERRREAVSALDVLSLDSIPRGGHPIRRIHLAQAGISDTDLEYFTALPEVEEIRIYDANVSEKGLWHLSRLEHLHTLSLTKCPVNDLDGLAGLTSLRELEIAHSWYQNDSGGLGDEGTTALETLSNLESLGLCCSAITDVTLWRLSGLTRLRALDLSGVNGISDDGLAALIDLNHLKELRLGVEPMANGPEGPITDDGLWHLAGLSELTILDLEGQRITDADLVALRGLVCLEHLNLKGTHVTPQGLEELLAVMPKIKERDVSRLLA